MTVSAQDRADVIDACTRMMWSIDVHDWETFPSVFAPEVTLDYTRLWGGEPDRATPQDVTAAWSALFRGFSATQHLLANHLVEVDGDRAVLTAVFQATHRGEDPFGGPLWTLGGTYRFGLVRIDGEWKIDEVEMTPTWAEGNKDVVAAARAGNHD
ncbi:nuclear transport factor 2 family protein [Spirillospora sp. NPDC052269]